MFVSNVFLLSIVSIYYILAEDFAAVLWHPSFPQSDYLIACRCVGLVAELAAAAARHLNDALHTVSIPNKQGPPHSHSTTIVTPN